MGVLDWLVIAIYVVALVLFSLWVGRGQSDGTDYYVGGRNLPWWAIGISTMATQSSAISSAYTSAWNTYVRAELGYDGDREYVPSGAVRGWNWERAGGSGTGFGGGSPNVAPDLANAMRRNPELEVLLINGIYDLATPYFAAVWTMDHMGLPSELRANIHRADFAAGHMMYVEQSLLPQWKDTLDAFILRTSGGPPAS